MSKPGPKAALDNVTLVLDLTSPPLRARTIIAKICETKKWTSSAEEALEKGETWEKRFLELARQELDRLSQLGRPTRFSFNSSSAYMLQGDAFLEPSDGLEVQEAKNKRALSNQYLKAIGALTPTRFERLCCGILKEFQVATPVLTPRSGDEGIDFFGQLQLEEIMEPSPVFPSVIRQLGVWMIGQAKHYTGAVSTFEVRELVGATTLAKGKAFSLGEDKYAELNMRVCDPIFYLFFTTGRLSSATWRLLERSGVIGMDGEMLAAFLAGRSIGCGADGQFAEDRFGDWLAELETG